MSRDSAPHPRVRPACAASGGLTVSQLVTCRVLDKRREAMDIKSFFAEISPIDDYFASLSPPSDYVTAQRSSIGLRGAGNKPHCK